MPRISPAVWHTHAPGRTLPPYTGTECYWVGDGTAVWLVDTGDGGQSAQEALFADWVAQGRPPVQAVLATHAHTDHTGSVHWAQGEWQVPVYLGTEDMAWANERLPAPVDWTAGSPGSLSIGSVPVDIIQAPGHTPGQLNVWLPNERLLLAGDNVLGASTSIVTPPQGHLGVYLSTLERLLALGPSRIAPGHGALIDEGERYLQYYLRHRKEREASILRVLSKVPPTTPRQVAEIVYRGQLSPESMGLGERMVLAHLDWLLEQGRIAKDGGGYFLP